MNTARLHAAVFEPIEKVLDRRLYSRILPHPQEKTPMDSPHENEYLAAVAHIHEQTPRATRTQEPAVGDFISGCTDGRRWSGHVEWVERGFVCVNVGGGWVSVATHDITH
jgi:hypothetical protein